MCWGKGALCALSAANLLISLFFGKGGLHYFSFAGDFGGGRRKKGPPAGLCRAGGRCVGGQTVCRLFFGPFFGIPACLVGEFGFVNHFVEEVFGAAGSHEVALEVAVDSLGIRGNILFHISLAAVPSAALRPLMLYQYLLL